MVIVVNHIISSAILYFQNPRRFHCQENAPDLAWQDDRLKQLSIHSEVPVSSGTHLQLFQDACLKFLEVGTVDELRSTIKDVLHLLFPDPLVCIVYLTDPGSGELYTEDGLRLSQFLPHQGICWEAINSRQGIIQTSIDPRDPVITAIKCHCDNTSTVPVSPVLSFPVVDITGDKVIALIVTSGGSTCIKDLDKLQPIGKQIVACFRRLCRTHSPVRQTSVNTEALVKLCGELYDHDASVLQLKVIKYLEEQTSAESSFLLLVVPDTQELFCQVVGDRVLAEELRFPGHNSSFATALETQQPIRLEDIPLDKRKGIEEFLEKKLQSFLCVPVTSRNSDSLIALVCVANKIGGDKFTEDDIFSIHQCFRYTAAVLTSTLAFQNERKLKIQTQAMLQVARNLFTRLGELLYKNSAFLDPFPLINSRGIQFNVAGMSFSDQLNSSPTVRCKNDPSVATSCNNNSSVEKYSFEKQLKQQEKIADLLTNKIPDKTNRYKCNSHFKSPSRIHTNHILHPPYKLPERTKEERGTANLSPKSLDTTVSSKDEVDFKKQLKINQKISDIIMSSTPIPPVAGQSRPIIDVVSPVTGQCRPIKDVVSPVAGQCRPIKDVVSPVAGQCSLGAVSPEISSAIGADQRTPDIRNVYQKSTAIPEIILESGSSGLEHTRDVVIQDEHHKTSSGNDYLSPIEGRNDDTVSFCGSCQSPLSFATALDYSSFSDDDDIDFSSSSQNSTFDADRSLESTAELDPLQKRSLSDIGLRDNETGANLVRISRSQPDIILTSLVSPSTVIESDVGIFTLESVRRSKEELCGVASEEVVKSEMRIIVEDSDTSLAHTISLSLIPNLYSGAYQGHKAKARLSSHSTEYIRGIQPPSTTFQDSYRNDLTKLLREVMQEARNLTHAERCSVFLIDNETEELVAKVFDGIPAEDNMIETEIRLPITQGIAGHVATTGQLLNIRDAYSHPMFYRGMDDSTGFRTRNILCFPLKDENGVVLGVAQLCNKKNGPCFTIFDEELALAFAVYCCISISHCLMYKKLQTSQQRNKLANELMIYHMQVCNEDVELLTKTEVTPTQVYDAEFAKFTYAPRSLPENDSLNASLSMFEDLGFISKYRIKLDTLARFLLMVKKGYRNPPYHNWMHAYTVSHFCFLLTKNLKLENYLEDIEIFALFVSCLCHDIDHRGTNNSFQVASKSVLAALYSSEGSVMERHHFAQTMCIVNTEGCNIFENLTSKDYQNVLDLIRDIILATDLAHHLRILKNIKEMAKAGYKKSVVRYRKLLLCLLMTSCDLSDQTKDWNNIKNIAGLIYQEFFSQGDVEKELGVEPIEMMDRERAQIPDLQISFLDHIATPLFSVLAEIFPEAKQVSDTVEDNRKHWLKVKELLLLRSHGSTSKMTLDEVLSVDEEISPEVFKNAPIQNGQ